MIIKVSSKGNKLNDGKPREEVKTYNQALDGSNLLKAEFDKLEGRTQGLAGPQIGVELRIILCRWSKRKKIPLIMINPVILKSYGKRESWEGCESCEKGVYYKVNRSLVVHMKYLNENMEEQFLWAFGKRARIIEHEIDHLNGLCINGKASRRWVKR